MSHITTIKNLPINKAVLDEVSKTIDFVCTTCESDKVNLGYGNWIKDVRCLITIPVPERQRHTHQYKPIKLAIDKCGEAHYDLYNSGLGARKILDNFMQQCARAKIILDLQAVGMSTPTSEVTLDNGVIELEVEV